MATVAQTSTSRKALRTVVVQMTPAQSETWTLGGTLLQPRSSRSWQTNWPR